MRDNLERENFLPQFLGFISAINLLNDLMKIFVSLDIFNCVIFKDLRFDYCKNSIYQ